MSSGWKLYWVLVAATLILYMVLVLWSLPIISREANGLVPFDLRPAGYSFESAKEFIGALSGDGMTFYLGTQHLLDLFYPAMLAAVLAIALWRLSQSWHRMIRLILMVFPIIGMLADYLENSAVSRMLHAGAETLTSDMVAKSSYWTILKSGATTVAMVFLLGLLLLALVRKLKSRRGAA
jgi:hypothetical protein